MAKYHAMHEGGEPAVDLAVVAAEFDWTWSETDVGRFAAAAGWDLGQWSPDSGSPIRTHLPVASPLVWPFVDGNLKYIHVGVSDRFDTEDPVGKEALYERFKQLGRGMKDGLGDARIEVLSRGFGLRFCWSRPLVFVELVGYSQQGIDLRLTNPEYEAWMQMVTADDDDGGWVYGYER
ncbi:DUF6301 family protein [Nocardia sp. NPDC059240]|uniref:DUF6301 family protein n=1 Tax=Nocardia sp. NPDC059240 TaxID=3346786 RepID=UPI0036C5F03E